MGAASTPPANFTGGDTQGLEPAPISTETRLDPIALQVIIIERFCADYGCVAKQDYFPISGGRS